MRTGRVLFPAIRWHPDHGFAPAARTIDLALQLDAGGFILFGGPAADVARLTTELRARSRAPLLIGADLERGAGQQFPGAVSLPPAAAFGALGDLEATRRAGELTAQEARALGVDWIYAPVADLDAEPANPIVGTRAWGVAPDVVAAHVGAWIDGCRAAGALACAKHFPGHGRTVTDSHLGLPVVGASRDALEADLLPFRVAVDRGVDSVMTAHVAYPALDASGRPATLSRRIITGLLRERFGFDGLVVTDALIMAGALGADADEGQAAVSALAAGCDVLLYPTDLERVVAALESARRRALPEARLADAVRRIEDAARRVALRRAEGRGSVEDPRRAASASAEQGAPVEDAARRAASPSGEEAGAAEDAARRLAWPRTEDGGGADDAAPGAASSRTHEWGRAEDREWALAIATRALHVVRGAPALATRTVELITVDDDVGGPFPPGPRTFFPAALAVSGIDVREAAAPDPARSTVVALYADIRGWKGRPHVSEAARERIRQALVTRPDATVVLFGHPRLGVQVPGESVLAAWGGDAVMQEAAARWLAARAR